jgi:hypothetical protein
VSALTTHFIMVRLAVSSDTMNLAELPWAQALPEADVNAAAASANTTPTRNIPVFVIIFIISRQEAIEAVRNNESQTSWQAGLYTRSAALSTAEGKQGSMVRVAFFKGKRRATLAAQRFPTVTP